MFHVIEQVVTEFVGFFVSGCTSLVCAAGVGVLMGFVIDICMLLILVLIAMWLTGKRSPLLLLFHKGKEA